MHRDTRDDAAPRQGDEAGQTMAEYGVVMAVIVLVVMLSLQVLSDSIVGLINSLIEALS